MIEGLLACGVPVSAIGIQSHQHQGYWGREKIEAVLSRYEKFGLPIHFTENTIVSGPAIPPEIRDLNDFRYEDNVSTPEYEEKQKNQMEEMYRILFEEHPLVKAVTNWDFGDGAWLNAPSGLIRRDGSVKPSYEMLKNLIWGEWSTNLELKTDSKGIVNFEGFKGEYSVFVNGKTTSFTLNDNSADITIQL